MELPAFERAVQLAEQFGPFLFAVLFILVITRTAHAWYQDAIRRDDPPPSAEERRTYRFYFLCSVWTRLAVMSLAVGWWLYANCAVTISIRRDQPFRIGEKFPVSYYKFGTVPEIAST